MNIKDVTKAQVMKIGKVSRNTLGHYNGEFFESNKTRRHTPW